MKPPFYSKTAIFIFSIFLTGFGGSVMLAYNLRKVGKNKIVIPLVVITLVVAGLLRQVVLQIMPGSLYELLIPSIIIGLLLTSSVWNKYLAEYPSYESKPVWIPLIVTVVLYGGIFSMIYMNSHR